MKHSFLTSGDVYAKALLADGFLDAHYRFLRSGRLAPEDAIWFEGASDFLENAFQGFLRTLSADEARALGKEHPPISRRKFTSAFKLAMAVWTSETWATKHPDFQISKDNIDREVGLYISAIDRALKSGKEPQAIEGLTRTREFFTELGKVALTADPERDLVPLNLNVTARV
jgi:hypothetical protein